MGSSLLNELATTRKKLVGDHLLFGIQFPITLIVSISNENCIDVVCYSNATLLHKYFALHKYYNFYIQSN